MDSGRTLPLVIPQIILAGNALIGLIWSQHTPTCTDSNNGSYGTAVSVGTNVSDGIIVSVFVLLNCKAGANTVTFDVGTNTDLMFGMIVEEPAASSVVYANNATYQGVSPTTNPIVSLVSTALNAICIGIFATGGSVAQSAGTLGTNAAFIPVSATSNIITQDGNSSGGTVNFASVGSAPTWAVAAIVLGSTSILTNVIFDSSNQ